MSGGLASHGSCLLGMALIIYGGWIAWQPLAFWLAGVLFCAFGVFVHQRARSVK